ncbi:MAG: AIR synthase related protein [Hymenobacter sp.]
MWKVETHNSPSAIDPYGGAITGILGNNRDPLATGIGGARLLFNTNVLCFGNPDYRRAVADRATAPAPHFGGRAQGHRGRRQQVGRADRERRHRVR